MKAIRMMTAVALAGSSGILRVRGRQRVIGRIDDEHGEQARGLGVAGVGAPPMTGDRSLVQ